MSDEVEKPWTGRRSDTEVHDTILKPLPEDLFVDHREGYSTDYIGGPGYNAEMRWEAMTGAGYLTPTDRFFVRSHAPTPEIDPSEWELRIDGDAATRPFSLGYEELMKLPSVTIVKALECAGNGRAFFREKQGRKPDGTNWRLGAIGVAEWVGVPLRDLLKRAGISPDAKCVMAESLDDARMRRPLSIEKAMEDVIVAYTMNGDYLSPDHGYPARLIVPGWGAVASVKWLGNLRISRDDLQSPWNTEKYVMRGYDYDGSPVTEQVVKSALELPWPANLRAGRHRISGRSWSPSGRVLRVEYSLDGGNDWREARLNGPNLAGAWACWSFDWTATSGGYEILIRSTDSLGAAQPDSVPPNELGYLYNGVAGHPVEVR